MCCLGVDAFAPGTAMADLKARMPRAQPTLEFGSQVYVRDPDGAKVRLASTAYTRR